MIARLTPRQYAVTQESATEPAFHNEFWDNEEAGIYVDIVSGEPLFASTKKFDSGCGWPSFTVPLEPANVVEKGPQPRDGPDRGAVGPRGQPSRPCLQRRPRRRGGLRYCINSAALRFVPYDELEAEGYGEYRSSSTGDDTKGGGPMSETTETAILAGGCFWGMQDLIRKRPGVLSTRVGYTGGDVANATYRNHGNHAEAIEITFDPEQTSYREHPRVLLPDPRPDDPEPPGQRHRARATGRPSSPSTTNSGGWPRTPSPTSRRRDCGRARWSPRSTPAGPFWEAEPEHQDYLERYPNGYTCHFPRPGWVLPRRSDAVA